MKDFLDKTDINQPPSDIQLQKNFVTSDNINTMKNELVNAIAGLNSLNASNDENLLKIFTNKTHLDFDINDITFDNNTNRKVTINMKGSDSIKPKTKPTTSNPYVSYFTSYSSQVYTNNESSTMLKNLIGIIKDGFNWEVTINFWSNNSFGSSLSNNNLLLKKVINITSNILYKKCVLCSILKNYNKVSQKFKRIFDLLNNDSNMMYYQQDILNIGKINTTLLYSPDNNILYLNGDSLNVGIIDIKEHPLTWYLFKDNTEFVEQTDDPDVIKIKSFDNKYIRGVSDINLLGSQQINQVGYHSHKTQPVSVSTVPDGNPTVLVGSSGGNELSSATVAWEGRKLPITVNIPELTANKQLDKNNVLVDSNYKTEVDSFNLLYYMNID